MRAFRLPDGTGTNFREVYFKAWDELCDAIVEFFPGYAVTAYDPGLQLAIGTGKAFDLRADVALLLIETVAKKYVHRDPRKE